MATTTGAATTMKVVQVSKAGADFQIVEREIPKPGAGHVRIKVQACGVCHSDVLTKDGLWPGIQYPRVPGHEVAGIIDEVGAGVPPGRRGSALVSAGTAARTTHAGNAGAEIFAIAAI
jgi:D-arabinose 1-dehydrogenase-like Zn-dependent alcohol dehydrogenase